MKYHNLLDLKKNNKKKLKISFYKSRLKCFLIL